MTRFELLNGLPLNSCGAEIGVQRGDFSANILRTKVSSLFLVDAWRPLPSDDPRDPAVLNEGGHEANYRHVCKRFDREILTGRVMIIREASPKAAAKFDDGQLDWAYIDAGHTFESALTDLIAWSKKVHRGGALMVHDYLDNEHTRKMGFGVIWAVKAFCDLARWEVDRVTDEEWPTALLVRL